MHGPSGQGEGGRTGELCFNHSLIHTNLSWNKSLSLTKKRYLNVRRNGAWIRLEEYWPYPANSPHHEVHADGCNNSGSDGEDTSNESEEEELDMNSTD